MLRPFFTRSPNHVSLRSLVERNTALDFDPSDFGKMFRAIDEHCSKTFSSRKPGSWFSPTYLGGAPIKHIPPHMISAAFAIYVDLAVGPLNPVPFLAQSLNMKGATAIQLDQADGFMAESSDGEIGPITDILFIIPAYMPEQWTLDLYGIPRLQDDVVRVVCVAASESCPTAIFSAQLLMHPFNRMVLNPLSSFFSSYEEQLFFLEPINSSRLERYRGRLADSFGTPLDVSERNHDSARDVLEAYLLRAVV